MQFANAFAFSENGNINRPSSPPLPVSPPASPRPAGGAGAGARGSSPLPSPSRMANQQRAQAENAARARVRRQAARNEELRRIRAIAPHAYEENGMLIIPPAGRRLAAPAPVPQRQPPIVSLPPIRPTVPEPEPEDPSVVNNNENPRPPRRRTRRHRSRKNSRRARR